MSCPTVYKINGRSVTAAEFRRHRPRGGGAAGAAAVTRAYRDGLTSRACAVHRTQAAEHREFVEQHRISGVEVLNDGRVRFAGRKARKDYLRARGLVDLDGGYGDG